MDFLTSLMLTRTFIRLLNLSMPCLQPASNPSFPLFKICSCFFRPFHTSRNVSFLEPHKAVQFGLQPFKGFAPFPFRNRLFQTFFGKKLPGRHKDLLWSSVWQFYLKLIIIHTTVEFIIILFTGFLYKI